MPKSPRGRPRQAKTITPIKLPPESTKDVTMTERQPKSQKTEIKDDNIDISYLDPEVEPNDHEIPWKLPLKQMSFLLLPI